MSGTREIGLAEKTTGCAYLSGFEASTRRYCTTQFFGLYTLQGIASIRVILVHAISGAAKRFYKNPASSPLLSTR